MAGRELTSIRSPRVKAARRLAKRAFRRREGLFLAEGPQAVREALEIPGGLAELFTTAETVRPSADAAVAALTDAGLLPADSARVTGPVMRVGETTPGSQLILHIREDV